MNSKDITIPIIISILIAAAGVIFVAYQTGKKDLPQNQILEETSLDLSENQEVTTTQETSTAEIERDTNMPSYTAVLNTTEGKITIKLNDTQTPKTVENFVTLAKKGFYNNTIFHRVIKGFMIQGGDPDGTGRGGPGYKFDDEPFTGEYTRGTVAMANAGPNTNGSQFFIMHSDNNLPKNYVIFGQVIDGLDAVDKIALAPVTRSDSGENSKPVNPAKIIDIQITEE